ncbi:hypothetical protein CC78DRAFT_267802 [Lojkania enalia]|uniref:Uncharacterized protein n=1 Tax=Lojkania enalia TaxID=147567 RepID=A0A9P4K8G0_9PLEO|nr:hypothetical protein CC78DRAFT_267802 [Didymosphaeria enalia]
MHKIPRILYLISSYAASYSVITATPNSQLDCANSLFHTLLTHYFPRDQGFQVQKWEPCKYDWSIELKSRTKDPKARAKEQPIFHRVPRENIGGFVVEKMHFVPRDNSHKDEEWIPHTFLAIMIDNLSTKPTWSTTALVQPRDILVPAFSLPPSIYNSNSPTQTSLSTPAPHTPILSAPAFLVLGPQIEFYTFDLHAERESDMCASVKPHRGHVIRICAENKIALGQMFEWVAGWEVRYEDGRVGEGARKWV